MMTFLILLLTVPLLPAPSGPDLALENELLELKKKAQRTPAEFMGNRVSAAHIQLKRFDLCGKRFHDRDRIRRELFALREAIRLGLDWLRPEGRILPRLAIPPVLDGEWSPGEWTGALVLRGEYPVNCRKAGDSRTIWRIGYDERNLYWSAQFYGAELKSDSLRPYRGDSLECFVIGDPRLRDYREFVIDCDGHTHVAWNVNRGDGTYDNRIVPAHNLRFGVKRLSGGFRVEAAIPWGEIPGYQPGGKAVPGAAGAFMLLRTSRSGFYAPVPFLYDGHNINGYIPFQLEKSSGKD